MKKFLFYPLGALACSAAFADTAPTAIVSPTIPDKTDTTLYQPLPTPDSLQDSPKAVQSESKAVNVTEQELLANPPLLHQALYSSVLNNHIAAIRLLLPLYEQLPSDKRLADDELMLVLARASLAKEDGKYRTAIDLYRQALAIDPSINAARFALAQSLYSDKQYRTAKQEFMALKDATNLPQPVQGAIGQYLTAIDKKDDWQFSANAYYTQDKNITNSPNYDKVDVGYGTWTLPKQESAQGIAYQLGANKDVHIADAWHSKTEFDVTGKWYWDNHKYDDMTVRGATGVSYQTASSELALLPYLEQRTYGNKRYSRELGVHSEFNTQLNPKNRLRTSLEYGKESYQNRPHLDGHRTQAVVSWLWLQNPKQYWTFSTDVSKKTAEDSSDAYQRTGVRLNWVRSWGNTNTSLSLGVAQKHYDGKDLLQILRKDKEYSTSLSIWDNRIRFWGMTPRLVGTYQKVDSNHPFYKYDKNGAFVQFSRSF